MEEESKAEADDDRPPICPACGVTMGIVVDEDQAERYVCLECGFSDEMPLVWRPASDSADRALESTEVVVRPPTRRARA